MVIHFRLKESLAFSDYYTHIGNRWMEWPEFERYQKVQGEPTEVIYLRWVQEAREMSERMRQVTAYRLMGPDGQVVREDVVCPLA